MEEGLISIRKIGLEFFFSKSELEEVEGKKGMKTEQIRTTKRHIRTTMSYDSTGITFKILSAEAKV